MADLLNGLKRTKMCGELRAQDINSVQVVMGFCAKHRNLGNLIFMDIRDRTGIIQVSVDYTTDKDVFDKASGIKSEYVVAVKGMVRSRGANINRNIPTGEVEIAATDIRILSEAEVTPFEIKDELNVNDALRLKYRYLDLRRPVMQKRLIMRDKAVKAARDYLAANGFLEIETPFLGLSTPEGARDYLVPSRIHPGCFYALPQSPQLYKQLLMIAGFDRYYQIARCFRDEDLRANRQPEFSQIDLEMSFVENEDDVMDIAEGMIKEIFNKCLSIKFSEPFPRMSYEQAMNDYGSDKPDLRFDMKLVDISDIALKTQFTVFTDAVNGGGSVRLINAKGAIDNFTRKALDKLSEEIKTFGAKGLAYILLKSDGITSPISKFTDENTLNEIILRADAETGDALFIVASTDNKTVFNALGGLRCLLAERLNLIKDEFKFVWVTGFPLLEYSEEESRYVAVHHPFTAPKDEDVDLLDTAPERVRSKAYDLAINGQEAGGGSIRIHTVKMQKRIFNKLGFSEEDIKRRFSFFVDAFRYGAPPHGGIAFGLDRLAMLLTGTDSIRDVMSFPKVQNASDLMSNAPGKVEEKQLKELNIKIND